MKIEIWYEARCIDRFGKHHAERFEFLGGARARRREIYRELVTSIPVTSVPELWSVQTGPGNARVEAEL